MTALLPNIFAIEVPADAADFAFHDIENVTKMVFSSKIQDPCKCGGDMLRIPPGNYEFICASLTATQEEAAKVVEKRGFAHSGEAYLSYVTGRPFYHYATMSLKTLLSSKGLNPELNYAIIKKLR